ncbi:MAG TPA: hypothetical protein VM942_06190 [Acidimicrobiales bacterium]|nr:hypothetical protein [Acidimicrobiales bacterium]
MRWRDSALGVPVELVATGAPVAVADLSPGERAQVPVVDGPRRGEWLQGRSALKQLLGPGTDTSTVTFPNRCLSLTHAAGLAVAARCDEEGGQVGLGVDFEGRRAIDPRAARFFLRDQEQGDLLRLWTVKEALFKATPDNGGAMLLDYEVDDAGALAGTATDRRGRRFRYASRRLRQGWLTIAVGHAAV